MLRLQDGIGSASGTDGSSSSIASTPAPAPVADQSSSVFDDNSFGWKQIESDNIISIPKHFTIEEITSYLTTIQVSLVVQGPIIRAGSGSDDEDKDTNVAAGTLKPTVKGRQMYVSKRLTLVEYVETATHIYFRGNCQASMRKDPRYPGVSIKKSNGKVDFAQCTCEARADQRCCHVATLLYCVEDLSLKQEPKISKPCTSQPQAWGKGSKRALDPAPVCQNNYSKKRKQDRYLAFDPRPENAPPPDINNFLQDLQMLAPNSMFEHIFRYTYEDYPLDANRQQLLGALICQMLAAFASDVFPYFEDPLSTESGVHVTGTEEQGQSDLWHKLRSLRITGSTFKDYASNPEKMARSLWSKKHDLSQIPSICWGTENESIAREAYEQETGHSVKICGIFISRRRPLFAASPDGICEDSNGEKVLIEIKCPYSLKDCDLTPPLPTNCAFLDANLQLKHSHQYYYQVQLGMYATGCRKTHFIV